MTDTRCFKVRADWAPKKDWKLTERELKDKRAYRGDKVWKNIRFGVETAALPDLKDDEVLIRVGACGICGSDLHALEMDEDRYSAFASHTRFPVTLGHEFSGEIVQTGKSVSRVKEGDLIAVEQIHWCGTCRSCRSGMFNQCEELEEVGLSSDGGFSEYAVIPEKYCCLLNDVYDRLGDKMATLEAGALVEPVAVAYSGMVVNAGFKQGSHVVVFGAGPIGLAAIMLAKAFGAGRIIAFNTNPARTLLAEKAGADFVYNPRDLNPGGPGALVMKQTDGIGAHMIVECSGNFPSVYPEIASCIANGAKVVQLGVGSRPASFEVMPFLRKNAHIIGSMGHAGNDVFPAVIRLMASGSIDARKIITGRFSLEEAEDAIRETGKRSLGHGKVLVSSRY